MPPAPRRLFAALRRAVMTTALLALVMVVTGCRLGDDPPDLLDAVAVTPTVVEVGDVVEVTGSSFPEGRRGSVTLLGDLHRPGRPTIHDVRIVAPVHQSTQSRVSFLLDDTLRDAICGLGREARHTTFRGSAVVAFAPRSPAAPPVTGTVRDVVLDVLGEAPTRQVAREQSAEAQRFLKFVGLELEASRTTLRVRAVRPHSPAAVAGVAAGDVLVELDGVQLRTVRDLVPAGTRHADFGLLRAGQVGPVALDGTDGAAGAPAGPVHLEVAIRGFRPPATERLSLALVVVLVVVLVLIVGVIPGMRLVTWAERRTVERLRPRRGPLDGGEDAIRRVLGELLLADGGKAPGFAEGLLRAVLPYAAFLSASAIFSLMAFRQSLLAADLDVPVLLLGATTGIVATSLVLAGASRRGFAFRRGMLGGLVALAFQFPAIVAVTCVTVLVGSPDPARIVSHQGAWPWEWHAVAGPAFLLGFVVYLLAFLPDGRAAGRPEEAAVGRALVGLAQWLDVFVLAGIGAAWFLGGWRLPFVSPTEQAGSIWLQLLGAVVMLLKTWALVLTALWMRWLAPSVPPLQLLRVTGRGLLLLTVATVGLTGLAVALPAREFLLRLEPALGVALFVALTVVVGRFAARVIRSARATRRPLGVDPWV